MVWIRHAVRRSSRTVGVTSPGLIDPVGKSRAETTGSRSQRSVASLVDIMAKGTGIGDAARRTVRVDDCFARVGCAPLPCGGMRFGKDVATGAGDSCDTAANIQTVERGCPLDAVAVLADGLVLFGQPPMDRGVHPGRFERYRVKVTESVVVAAGGPAGRGGRNNGRIGAGGVADGAGCRVSRIGVGMSRGDGDRGRPGPGRMR